MTDRTRISHARPCFNGFQWAWLGTQPTTNAGNTPAGTSPRGSRAEKGLAGWTRRASTSRLDDRAGRTSQLRRMNTMPPLNIVQPPFLPLEMPTTFCPQPCLPYLLIGSEYPRPCISQHTERRHVDGLAGFMNQFSRGYPIYWVTWRRPGASRELLPTIGRAG
jgi:hypothetical protein